MCYYCLYMFIYMLYICLYIFPKQLVCKGPLYLFKTGFCAPASDFVARGPVVPFIF